MLLLPLILLQAAPDDAALVAAARERTRAEVPCASTHNKDEITVCGRRDADRYRVNFVTTDPLDSVPTERNELLHNPIPRCGISGPFFLESCGMVGVSISTTGGPVRVKTRKLAD